MDAINLGLIGFGAWPREAYAPVIQSLAGARVAAVSARSEATADEARGKFGDDINTHPDYRDLLADDSVDAVMVAVPNEIHAEVIQAAAGSGKHVFLEPPLGLNEAEIQASLAALAGSDAIVHADHELRYTPVMERVARVLKSEPIGEVLSATVGLRCNWGYGGGEWLDEVESQGFFLWLGCWYLDVLDAVFARTPRRASVVGGYAMNRTLMDHGWAGFEYPGGKLGCIEFNLVSVEEQEVSLRIDCTEGEIHVDLWSGQCEWRARDGAPQALLVPCAQPIHGFSGMHESIAAFLGCIRDGSPSRAGLDVCRRVHEMALACARSEADRASVSVESL